MDQRSTLFNDNKGQHTSACAKMISSWIRKVLSIAKEHVSPVAVWGVATSLALVAGVSLVSKLQVGDCAMVSTPANKNFST